jgi:hypothetical protein
VQGPQRMLPLRALGCNLSAGTVGVPARRFCALGGSGGKLSAAPQRHYVVQSSVTESITKKEIPTPKLGTWELGISIG